MKGTPQRASSPRSGGKPQGSLKRPLGIFVNTGLTPTAPPTGPHRRDCGVYDHARERGGGGGRFVSLSVASVNAERNHSGPAVWD